MKEDIKKAIENEDDNALIKAIIEVYVNEDLNDSHDDIMYEVFSRAMTHFGVSHWEEFMQLSEVACNYALAINSVQSIRLYYEMKSASSYLLSDFEETIKILENYENYCRENNFLDILHFIIGNQATIEIEMGHYEAARKTLQRTYDAAKGQPTAVYYVNHARIDLLENITEGVLEKLEKALTFEELDINYMNKVETYLYFAQYYILLENKERSLEWYKKTIHLIENYNIGMQERRVYKELARLLSDYGNYKESHVYLLKYSQLLENAVKKERELMATKSKLQKYINEKELENKLLRKANEEVVEISNRDFLTGIYNRRYMTEYMSQLMEEEVVDFYVMIFDIDDFKKINDSFGHITGDFIIREAACLVDDAIQKHFIARTGGDEFVLIFNQVTKGKAIELGERVRKILGDHIFTYDGEDLQISISAGMRHVDKKLDHSEILRDADVMLYRSKRNGKNQVML